jgi:hypothetical protein
MPYQRKGGGYKQKSEAATAAEAALKAAGAAAKAGEKKAVEKETIADLRGQIATLKAELKAEKESKDLAVSGAKLEVEQKFGKAMLDRYRDGLRDGASLSRGAGMLSGSPALSGFGGSPAL